MSTRTCFTFLALSGIAALAACAALSPEAQQGAIAGIEAAVQNGTLSREQADAAIEALSGGGFGHILDLVITGALTILTGIPVGAGLITRWRGPINARKGEVPAPTVIVTPPAAAQPA